MRKFNLIAALLLSSILSAAQIWKSDKNHSRLSFTVTHWMINDITGRFDSFEVKITSAKPDFSDAVFELTADVKSINTHVQLRDDHLRTADFFDAEKFPLLHFISTGIKRNGKNKYKLTGNLSIRGITKQIVADLIFRGTTVNPRDQKMMAGFQLFSKIKRSDFKIGSSFSFSEISDEVRIKADGEFRE